MRITCINCHTDRIEEVVKGNRRYYYCSNCDKLYERAFDTSYGKDISINDPHGIMHVCVGAIIKQANRYLLIKRRAFPFGYALPAGHVEYGEKPLDGLKREVYEETSLVVTNCELLYEGEVPGSKCRYGADRHYWHYYACFFESGLPFLNTESESVGWYSTEEMKELELIPSAKFIFNKILHSS